MLPMAENTAEELERFRRQWQEEVSARAKVAVPASTSTTPAQPKHISNESQRFAPITVPTFHKPYREISEADVSADHDYHDLRDIDEARNFGDAGVGIDSDSQREPSSALEHYERAVERESEGSLGDSLTLYRKAFRLDASVDRTYKNKHFPPSFFMSKSTGTSLSNDTVAVPDIAHHSLDRPLVSSVPQLIASFSSLSIPATEPATEASPTPPCPISILPSEILISILLHTAISDVASFARLSLICKRLAYLVATEDRIWRRLCIGSEVGFAGMQYEWTCSIIGAPLPNPLDNGLSTLTRVDSPLVPPAPFFPLSTIYPTHRLMLHSRPRIRFSGCYISTVNYIRPGGNTASQVSFNTPVHVVTYYRYLRFFRDGSCASLLTTTEPADVVHHLTKENMHTRHASGLPSSVMNGALRGRWRLSGNPYKAPSTINEHDRDKREEDGEGEGTLHIETEGADAGHPHPKYIYKMELQLKSARKGHGATRNNKLAWIGYWSYNKLTDDWAEFGLRNDKAYVWSRVKSYGYNY